MLSPDQVRQRAGKLTASRVACLMNGPEAAIYRLWQEMVGDPDFEPEDLSGVWPVALGSHTEALNLDWFERKRGPISRRGDVVTHGNGWAACTLDGWSDVHACPVEAKHVGGREPLEVIIARYQPQMHWQMLVTSANQCALSVIMGANEPTVDFIEMDDAYARELWRRGIAFMQCVWSLTPPFALDPVAPPVKPEKAYDYTTHNQWCSEAVTFITTRAAAKDFAAAEKTLKGLVPADAIRVTGGGLECKRDHAGRLSLREVQ